MVVDFTPEQLASQAETFLGFRKYDDAINLLRSKESPNDPRFCGILARAYYLRGDTRGDVYSGHYFAKRAIELGNTNPTVIAVAAVTAFRKERFKEAVDYFARYVDEQAGTATQFMYGLSLLMADRPKDALPWLDRVATWEPNNAEYKAAKERAEKAAKGELAAEKREWTRADRGLGGPNDARPLNVDSPYPSNAVSKLRGVTAHPKDFHWLEKNIPCQSACPANTDIPSYLNAIYKGDYDKAYKINLHDNVFPAVLGRVCSRPCETACRHGWDGLGDPVAICFSKRSASDFKTQGLVVMDPWFPKSGKKVAVVGAGPGGLAAARNLALMGHDVTVYEKHNKPGGMMNQGIPEFRLPRDGIDQEIEQVRRQGVKIVCNTAIGKDITVDQLVKDFDAVVLAAGTLRPNLIDIPGKELKGIQHGLEFLLDANETRGSKVGESILVIGGGFTAMDCARTAARLGAETIQLEIETDDQGHNVLMKLKGEAVKVLYRRSQTEMLITPGELEELDHEGIPMHFMVAPKAYIGKDGCVKAMRFVRTELGEADASGRRKPVEVPGSDFDVPATTILLATGQFPDTAWITGKLREQLVGKDQWLTSGKAQQTAHAKIFAAGDFATGARTLIEAIGHGKECAQQIDAFLMGEQRLRKVAVIEDVTESGRIREMDYVERQPMPMLPLHHRSLAAEVEQGFSPDLAVEETQRCYLCHYKFEIDPDKCIYCDWCIKAKPRPDCIVKVSSLIYDDQERITGFWRAKNTEQTKLIWINQADCIRCGACVEACPVDAISIQKVSLRQERASDGAHTVDLPVHGA